MSYYMLRPCDVGEPGVTNTHAEYNGELDERWILLSPGESVDGWPSITFERRGKDWPDLLENDSMGDLVSQRARDIIEPLAGERVTWLPVYVRAKKEGRAYWLMHLTRTDDVLDMERSDGDRKSVIKPFVDEEKAKGLHLFTWDGDERILVSEELKRAAEAAGLSNFAFTPASD